jgi:hypothetical protein
VGDVLNSAEFEEILRKVKEGLDKLEPMYGQMSSNITGNAIWWALPPPVKDKINQWLAELWDWIKKISAEIGTFFAQPGAPHILWQCGQNWTREVGAKASNWQDTMHVSQLKTDDEWKGAAATAYKDILPLQQKALGAIKAATDEVQDVLTKLAVAIGAAWIAVGAALAVFLFEFGAAVVAAATGAGILAALGAALASCVKVWGVIAAALTALEGFVGATLVPSITDLQQRVTHNDGFPRGHWPALTRDISDSSMQDDDSDPNTDDVDWERSKA